ncbi:hypothetical protein RSW84_28400, partial [Escherichia coli]|uniref:hypothetical protein n=1 Tax=Escherichia coli TaxID=562 RepID=UPI0028DF13CD
RHQVLAGPHGGHLQLLSQLGGALWAVALEQKQYLVGAGVHGKALIVGRCGRLRGRGSGMDKSIMGRGIF